MDTISSHRARRLAILFLWLSASSLLQAQTSQSGLVSALPGGTVANYTFAKPGDLTIIVNVWGNVDKPGRYEISSTLNLINLLSLAGGPGREAKLGEVSITRLVGSDSTVRRVTFIINLEDLTKVSERDLTLYPGDTIILERSSWSKFWEVFNTIAPVLSLAYIVVQLTYYVTRR